MGNSETVFDIVAKLIVEAELNCQHALIENFDDILVALSLDSGLCVGEVQSRLVEKMLADKNSAYIIANVLSIWDADALAKANTRA